MVSGAGAGPPVDSVPSMRREEGRTGCEGGGQVENGGEGLRGGGVSSAGEGGLGLGLGLDLGMG